MSSENESKVNNNKRARELCESSEQHGNTELGGVSLIERLPNEIFFHIFSCLMPHTLKVTTFVSKFWHQISESEDVWKEICNVRGWDDSTEFLAEYQHGIPRTKSYKHIYYEWKDDRESCCVCGDQTKRYHYILDMALCKKCYKSDPDYKLISKTECKLVYLLDDYDLTFLRSSVEPPKPFTHVFLKSDVEKFVARKQKKKEVKEEEAKRLKITNEEETQIKAKEDNSKNEPNIQINDNNNNNNNDNNNNNNNNNNNDNNDNNNNNNEINSSDNNNNDKRIYNNDNNNNNDDNNNKNDKHILTKYEMRLAETLKISLWDLYHKGNLWGHLQSHYRKILNLETMQDNFFDYSKFFTPQLQDLEGEKCKVYHPTCDPFENVWLSPLYPYDRVKFLEYMKAKYDVDWYTLQSGLCKYWENDNICEVGLWLANVNILVDIHNYMKNRWEDFGEDKAPLFNPINIISNIRSADTTELPPLSTDRTFEKFLPILTQQQTSARSLFRAIIEQVISLYQGGFWDHLFDETNNERLFGDLENGEELIAFSALYRKFQIPQEVKDEIEYQRIRREGQLENADNEEEEGGEDEWLPLENFVGN